MKIGNSVETPAVAGHGAAPARPAAGESAAAGRSAAAAETGGAAAASVTVKLSSTATALLASNAEFDAQKVEAIRQAIADGTYRVNPEAIADKLIANARELLDRRSR